MIGSAQDHAPARRALLNSIDPTTRSAGPIDVRKCSTHALAAPDRAQLSFRDGADRPRQHFAGVLDLATHRTVRCRTLSRRHDGICRRHLDDGRLFRSRVAQALRSARNSRLRARCPDARRHAVCLLALLRRRQDHGGQRHLLRAVPRLDRTRGLRRAAGHVLADLGRAARDRGCGNPGLPLYGAPLARHFRSRPRSTSSKRRLATSGLPSTMASLAT